MHFSATAPLRFAVPRHFYTWHFHCYCMRFNATAFHIHSSPCRCSSPCFAIPLQFSSFRCHSIAFAPLFFALPQQCHYKPSHSTAHLFHATPPQIFSLPCLSISMLFHRVSKLICAMPWRFNAIPFRSITLPCSSIAFLSVHFHCVSWPFCAVPWQLSADLCPGVSMLFHSMPLRSITLICSAFAAQNPAIPSLLIALPSWSTHCYSIAPHSLAVALLFISFRGHAIAPLISA